jgi:hypothetical protein
MRRPWDCKELNGPTATSNFSTNNSTSFKTNSAGARFELVFD